MRVRFNIEVKTLDKNKLIKNVDYKKKLLL